jgi:acyl-CoA reductase-like NAD-dependent aldehyde dehydrogenase
LPGVAAGGVARLGRAHSLTLVVTTKELIPIDAARLFINGEWVSGATRVALSARYSGRDLGDVHCASPEQVDDAVRGLARAARTVLPPYERFQVLTRTAALIEGNRARLVDSIVQESGFTRRDAHVEVDRSVQTFRLSAEEATRLNGDVIPLDGAPNVSRRIGYTMRVPVGVVCAITPFNSPLNTVSHKVAPALAGGNAVALKPALATPVTSTLLVELLLEAGLPASHIALLHGGGAEVGSVLLAHQDIGFYTFTGSTEVGKLVQRSAGLRRTQLELGSLSSVLLLPDADVATVAGRCVNAAFRKAGQVCTSVQRIYVHESVREEFTAELVRLTLAQEVGDPDRDEATVGPLITDAAATRVHAWVVEAQASGATVLCGGELDGGIVTPTVLTGVEPDMKVMCAEVFGPVVNVRGFSDPEAAMSEINDTPYGLAVGVFTDDLNVALRAADRLDFGSVHINETPSSRIDLMPYGGVKESGFGHEGPKYAAREMTRERLITISYR